MKPVYIPFYIDIMCRGKLNRIINLTKNQNIIKSRLKKELEKIPDLEENSKYLWEKQRINTFNKL